MLICESNLVLDIPCQPQKFFGTRIKKGRLPHPDSRFHPTIFMKPWEDVSCCSLYSTNICEFINNFEAKSFIQNGYLF
jgi:hypothetical protein